MSRELKSAEELTNSYVDERVRYLLPIFEELAPYKISDRKKGKSQLPGWQKLAAQEAKQLRINYPDDRPEEEKEYATCSRQITSLKKALDSAAKTQLKDDKLYYPVSTIIKNFHLALREHFQSYKEQAKLRYRQDVATRSTPENRIVLDLTEALKFAKETLTNAVNGDESNWMDVSCSIALATGRRMAEIHLSAEFTPVGDYEVEFTGHLKAKGRKEKVGNKNVAIRELSYSIPTLLPANLVCGGLKWLDEKGKRFERDEDTERVNRRWSKVLNQACKSWEIFPEDERTYHKFRAAYLRASIINDGKVDPYDFRNFAKKILGDNDEQTIDSYKRYEIKPGSITKI